MADLETVCDGLAARLATITALGSGRAHAEYPDAIVPPCAIVMPDDNDELADYDQTLGGNDTMWHLVVLLLVPLGSMRQAQNDARAYLSNTGTRSLKAAIDGDGTLGGAAHFSLVGNPRDYGRHTEGGVLCWGFVLPVDIWTQ